MYFAFKAGRFRRDLSFADLLAGPKLPSEHPFFPGDSIKYHFLFCFRRRTCHFLLNIVWSVIWSALSRFGASVPILTFASSCSVAALARILPALLLASSPRRFRPACSGFSSCIETSWIYGILLLGLSVRGRLGRPFGRGYSNHRHLITRRILFDLYISCRVHTGRCHPRPRLVRQKLRRRRYRQGIYGQTSPLLAETSIGGYQAFVFCGCDRLLPYWTARSLFRPL